MPRLIYYLLLTLCLLSCNMPDDSTLPTTSSKPDEGIAASTSSVEEGQEDAQTNEPIGTVLPTSALANTPSAQATTTPTRILATSASPTATALREPSQLTVLVNLPPTQFEQLEQEVAQIMADYPYLSVELAMYEDSQRVMTAISAGERSFDLILASPILLGNLWTTDQLLPMSSLFPSSTLARFAAVARAGAEHDGELWGLPESAGFHLLLFYNRALVDTPPTNSAAMLRLSRQIYQREEKWGLALNSNDPLWLLPLLAPFNGWVVDRSGQPSLNTLAMQAALDSYRSWHDAPGVLPPSDYGEVRQLFLNGQLGMMIEGEWAIGELISTNKVEWAVAPLPALGSVGGAKPLKPLVLSRYWVISPRVQVENRAVAVATLLTELTRPERQLSWAEQFGLLPTHQQTLDDPRIQNHPHLRVSAEQMQNGQTLPLGMNPNTLLNRMRDPLRGLLTNELSPAQVAAQMESE